MMLESGKYYKHIRNTDVAIHVMFSEDLGSVQKITAMWMNLTVKKPFAIVMDKFNIKKADLINWKPYDIVNKREISV